MVIDGKKLAFEREKKLTRKVLDFKNTSGITPTLVVVMIGDDPASRLYLKVKEKAAKRVGIKFEKKEFPAGVEAGRVIEFIQKANKNPLVHGLMVQLPLPPELDKKNSKLKILDSINSTKDVDCLTQENLKPLKQGEYRFLPAAVQAVLMVLEEIVSSNFFTQCSLPDRSFKTIRYRNSLTPRVNKVHMVHLGGVHLATPEVRGRLSGKAIVVVGASGMVGKPLVDYLKGIGLRVIACDEFTKDLAVKTKKADVLISAVGAPGLIKKEMVRKGAIVIDIASPKGDVDFAEVKKIVSFITPVPGGVGPLTVAGLLENVLLAANEPSGFKKRLGLVKMGFGADQT